MFYIGIALEKGAFKVAVLKKVNTVASIESLYTFPYGPDNARSFYSLPPFQTGRERLIASGIPSSKTCIRKLHLPLRDKRKILAALPFQLESLIPFPAESALICALFKPLSKQMTTVTVIATTEEHLTSHLAALKEREIFVDAVSCEPAALMRFGAWSFPKVNKILGLDVRDEKLSCVVYEGSEILLSQTLSASSEKEILIELEKLAVFLEQKGIIEGNTPLLLTGEPPFTEQIKKVFQREVLSLEDSALADYALAIGLGLDLLKGDHTSVQFCTKQFTPTHTALRRKKNVMTYVACCLGAALLMVTGGALTLNKRQNKLVHELQEHLPPNLSTKALDSPQAMKQALIEWERSLRMAKNTFALHPNVPSVSDVLAWLSDHPSLTTEDGRQKEGIEIKSVRYRLTKYPKVTEPSLPYLGQVEIEFIAQTPRFARDFHESLLKGDSIVNAKKEIKWHTEQQTYYTSFELNKERFQ
jgi:type IV pilus assembly protein PilM